jgi:DNA polymerase III subunit delta
VPDLKPAYLIHGDDHGAVAERRAGLRTMAEAGDGDGGSVELLDGPEATPAAVAEALAAMTLAIGRRVIIVEGVERWKEADVESRLTPAMAQMPPETTLAMFAREESRAKAPAALHKAVKGAGGVVAARMTVKPWELGKWARAQAAQLGLQLDPAAAKALVTQVGERQQRLLRELEKLAIEGDQRAGGRTIGLEEVEQRTAHSAESKAYALADALVAADAAAATRTYMHLHGQGERLAGLLYLMAGRLRDALDVALRLQSGESAATVKRGLRMPPRAAERFLSDVARSDPDRLRAALGTLAELELDSRGGALISTSRAPMALLSEDTLVVRAIQKITS